MRGKRFAVIAAAVVLVLAAVLLAVFGRGGAETPAVLLPPAGAQSGEGGGTLAEVTPETVQAVIGTLSRPDSYSRTVTTEDFWPGGSSSTQLQVRVSAGATRINLARAGTTENILLNDDGVYIWYDNSDEVFHSYASDGSDADDWLRAVTYEELLELPAEEITGAGYGRYAGESCIWAQHDSELTGYRETAYISVSTGILMGVEVYDGDTLIYRMTSGAPSITTQSEELFTPPATQ